MKLRILGCLAVLLVLVSSNSDAKIKRSWTAKHSFCQMTGYPGCHRPGYVVDHITPLACGGADSPFNMQWQTIAEGKAKDKWERKGCQHKRR